MTRGAPAPEFASLPRDLPAALARAAAQRPERGFVFVEGDGREIACTYGELAADAGQIAVGLAAAGQARGTHVLLALARPREFLPAFWGCLTAGVVPVPVSVPRGSAPLLDDAKVSAAWRGLGEPPLLVAGPRGVGSQPGSASQPRCLELDALRRAGTAAAGPGLQAGAPDPAAPAFLLLTSGTTGTPRFVTHTHHSVLSLCAATALHNHFTADEISLNWFPLDHVGGLVMFHLRDVFLGCQQVHATIDPVLREPVVWLDWIERFRATVTWAPNFAYSLVTARAAELERRTWDLSSMRFVLNGGEPIVARQARRFLAALERHGLRADAMHPAWGMSETCSGIAYSNRFSLATTSDDDPAVAVGEPIPGAAFRIVDPDGRVVEEGTVGALEVTGPTITSGYHGDAAANAAAFTADGWFRTGDLARLADRQLTITGREKDVVIVNGLNFACHDIEAVVEDVPGVKPSFAVALGVRSAEDPTDRLAICFVADPARAVAPEQIAAAIRERVAQQLGVVPRLLLSIAEADVVKTAIGKIQRRPLRERIESGELAAAIVGPVVAAAENLPSGEELGAPPADDLALRVRSIVAGALQVSAEQVPVEGPLQAAVTLDSLAMVEILCALEDEFTLAIRGDDFDERVSLADLVAVVRKLSGPG